jgi:hypothetical protein
MGSGYRTFTAGEVLTASNVQNFLQDQVVMVFADSTARATSIGTANFEEGMVSYLENSDTVEVYNGTTWGSIAPVSSQGLTLINTTSFSGVTSQSVNDVFSATYENYRIIIEQGAQGATLNQKLKLRVGGADSSASYYTGGFLSNVGGTANISENNQTTGWWINPNDISHLSVSLDIYKPFATDRTRINGQSTHKYYSSVRGNYFGGFHDVATSYTGFTLINDGNQTGVIYVYGYNK